MVGATVGISVLELGFAAGAAYVARAAWRSRESPAGFPVFVLTTAGCLFSVVSGLESLFAHSTATFLFAHLKWPLGGLVAVGTFYTAVEYTNQRQLRQPSVLALLVGLVIADAVAFLTNPIHELLLADPAVESGLFVSTDGPFLWVHMVVFFGLAGTGLLQLVRTYRARPVYRRQTAAIAVGIGIAFVFFVLGSTVMVHPAFELATVGILVGSTVLLWAINRVQLLEAVPIARKTLMDNMDEYLIAIDIEDRIIDANERVDDFLDSEGDLLGQPISDAFEPYPTLLEALQTTEQVERDITLQVDGQYRYYRLTVSPITYEPGFVGDTSAQVGRLVTINDITEQHRRKEELDLLKQVFARVLRHNMRNDLNVILGNAKLLSEEVPESDDHAAVVLECARDVLDMSEKARDLEAVIESPRRRERIPLRPVLERAVESVGEAYPDARIDISVDDDCYVLAHPRLEMALRNVIENACEHDTSPPTTVEITASAGTETVTLSITDDGPGIPSHEVEVLESGSEQRLKHGSGIGLWIIVWVTNRSDAKIDITTDEDGSVVTFTFLRPEAADTGSGESEPSLEAASTD